MSNNCKTCECDCMLLTVKCLEDTNSKLKKICLTDHGELIDHVNYFVLLGNKSKESGQFDGLLGECYHVLCQAVKEAQTQADQWNSITPKPQDWEFRDKFYYLDEKWANLLNLRLFKQMYASFVYAYWIHDNGESNTTPIGEISKESFSVKELGGINSYQNLATKDKNNKTASAFRTANRYKNMVADWLECRKEIYPCLPKNCVQTCTKTIVKEPFVRGEVI